MNIQINRASRKSCEVAITFSSLGILFLMRTPHMMLLFGASTLMMSYQARLKKTAPDTLTVKNMKKIKVGFAYEYHTWMSLYIIKIHVAGPTYTKQIHSHVESTIHVVSNDGSTIRSKHAYILNLTLISKVLNIGSILTLTGPLICCWK